LAINVTVIIRFQILTGATKHLQSVYLFIFNFLQLGMCWQTGQI